MGHGNTFENAPNGSTHDDFPPGKSPDEIACIVAELGEELGVWARPAAPVRPSVAASYDDETCELAPYGADIEVVDASVMEVAPDEILEVEPDPVELSVVEFIDSSYQLSVAELDDVETIQPVPLPPHGAAGPQHLPPLPPAPRRSVNAARLAWSVHDENTSTNLFLV